VRHWGKRWSNLNEIIKRIIREIKVAKTFILHEIHGRKAAIKTRGVKKKEKSLNIIGSR